MYGWLVTGHYFSRMLHKHLTVALVALTMGSLSAQDSPRYGRDKFRQLDQ